MVKEDIKTILHQLISGIHAMENLEDTLHANLEKLQIGHLSMEGFCTAQFNPFAVSSKQLITSSSSTSKSEPEKSFQSLSLYGADYPSTSCSFSQKKKSQGSVLVHKTVFKQPLLQKSRLGPIGRRLLKPAVLQLRDSLALMRPLESPSALTSHLSSLDLTAAGGKVLGLDRNMSDFHSLVSVDVSKLNLKSLSRFDAVSFIKLRTKRDKHFIVSLRAQRRRTYSDSTALAVTSGEGDSADRLSQRPQASCSLQATMTSPDDTSIDELASYFDLFVHIPKKMSHMAEMMYI